MSSLTGGGPVQLTADQLIAGFQAGLHPGKVSHHLATNYRMAVDGDRAELWAHGYAWNRVPALPAAPISGRRGELPAEFPASRRGVAARRISLLLEADARQRRRAHPQPVRPTPALAVDKRGLAADKRERGWAPPPSQPPSGDKGP
jgi:hypothetical protein